MRLNVFLLALVAASLVVASGEEQQQQQQKRILRRVIKSTPTATNLGRVRLVTVRAAGPAEKGAVSEINSKEAASFGQRSSNETNTQQPASTKTKSVTGNTQSPIPSNPSTTTSTSAPKAATPSTTTTTTTTTAIPTTAASNIPAVTVPKASERQQVAPEVELLSSAPSSWQMMTAVEAPAAALIAAGARPAASVDLSTSSSSSEYSSALTHADFLRASSGTKGSSQSTGQIYQSSREQSGKVKQQQSFFYPQQQQVRQSTKTSNYQGTKTQWYQPTSTTPRPAPIVQEPQYEQYVEQQQVESAPPGQAEPFAFDFNTQDTSGNGQYRKEESDNNGVVRGSYGFRDASGLYRHVEYIADHNGFRANIKSNEPGMEGGRDSQPASIKLDNGPAPASSQRFTNNDNADWTANSGSSVERADLALAPPNFESSHRAERIRGNFRK